MRILHILDHSIPLQSGYSFRTVSILRQQRALGWHTIQLTGPRQGNSSGEEHPNDGWHFFRTKPSSGPCSKLPGVRHLNSAYDMSRRLRHVAKLTRPDILHAHSPAFNAMAALHVGRSLGVPVVYEIRSLPDDAARDHGATLEGRLRYRLLRAFETFVARRADAVTTVCEALRTEIAGRGISPRKITVIPNALNVQHFTTLPTRDLALAAELGIGKAPTIGFIGTLHDFEGLDLLLDALPLMLRSQPQLRLLLVGGGPHEHLLRLRAASLGCHGRVIFTGRIAHERLASYYGLIDLLVYPRTGMHLSELSAPLKPLEAMAHGRLVLASDLAAHRELIVHGKTGVLFQADSAIALADSALELLSNRASWAPLCRAARHYVETERTWAASVARYSSVYAAVLKRRRVA